MEANSFVGSTASQPHTSTWQRFQRCLCWGRNLLTRVRASPGAIRQMAPRGASPPFRLTDRDTSLAKRMIRTNGVRMAVVAVSELKVNYEFFWGALRSQLGVARLCGL